LPRCAPLAEPGRLRGARIVHNAAMKRPLVLLVSLLLMLACASDGAMARNRSSNKARDRALYDYASTIHWNEFDKAVAYLDPLWLADHPLTELDMDRYKQVQITGYDVRTAELEPDGSYDQVVEIRLINIYTQVERVITDHQHWRWDAKSKHWWLTTGLPDITSGNE
jgi:hypothetical protein